MSYLTPEQLLPQTLRSQPEPDQPQPDRFTSTTPLTDQMRRKRDRLNSFIHINFDAISYAVPANDGSPCGVYLMPEMHFYSDLDKAIDAWVSQLPLSEDDRLDAHEALWEELTDNRELKVTLGQLGLTHPRADQIRRANELSRHRHWREQEQERLQKEARDAAEALQQHLEDTAAAKAAQHQLLEDFRAAENRKRLREDARAEQALTNTQQAAKTQAEINQERMSVVRSYRSNSSQ